MSDAVDQRFAPPVAYVEDVRAAVDDELASRWTRFVGACVDGMILGSAYFALKVVTAIGTVVSATDGDPTDALALRPATFVLSLGLFLLINGWLLIKRGQTVGKILCKTRIVRVDGSPVDASRLALRQGLAYLAHLLPAASMLYGLIDSLMIYRTSRRCLHDSIADTKVIRL